jgi:dCTP deaminase
VSILVDFEIRNEIESGRLIIDPFDLSLLNPASLDIRLGNKFAHVRATGKNLWKDIVPVIDLTNPDSFTYDYEEADEYLLQPNEFIIAEMYEKVKLPDDISFKLFGKSSWARAGLDNSSAAAWAECGFAGSVVLEIKNLTNQHHILKSGMKCGQLIFYKHSPAEIPYDKKSTSRYRDQVGLQGSLGV